MPDPSSHLPARPSLEQLKKQAKELLKQHHAGNGTALTRCRVAGMRPSSTQATLADAQSVLAREYGFESWTVLRDQVDIMRSTRPLFLSSSEPFYSIDWLNNQITVLPHLKTYYAGKTGITDRSLEVLGRMASLERIELRQCAGITDALVTQLAPLPKLRSISLHGLTKVTREAAAMFPAQVHIDSSE